MISFLKNGNGLVPCEIWEPNCWVNVIQPSSADKDFVVNKLQVPEAFYDDIEDVDERPRIEVEDGWCFVLMRIPCKSTEVISSASFATVPLGIIFKDKVFVSVCFYRNELIPDFIQYTRRKNIQRTDSINFIFRLLLSSSVWFLKYLKQINNQTRIAEKELEKSIHNEDLQTMMKLEKSLVFFTTSLRGNEILIRRLTNLRPFKDKYDPELVEDVEIESRQALEMTNVYSDILTGMMDSYASVISNNLNMVMKRLTTISIVLMMPTLIASYFGMNFEFDGWRFPLVIIASIVMTIVVTLIFFKKKWF